MHVAFVEFEGMKNRCFGVFVTWGGVLGVVALGTSERYGGEEA